MICGLGGKLLYSSRLVKGMLFIVVRLVVRMMLLWLLGVIISMLGLSSCMVLGMVWVYSMIFCIWCCL